MRKFLKSISKVMVAVVTLTSALLPMQTYASAGQFISQWANVRTTTTTTVAVPRGNWVDIARVRAPGSEAPKLEMLRGERWITLGREEVGMLGISSGQAVDILKLFPGKSMQLFARYSPENAQLRISLVRLEPRPDGFIYVSKGDWTPHHGEFDRAYRRHLTPAEKANLTLTGYNPFQAFRGSNDDPVFYNINFSAALVAMGHAMRMNQAAVGWLAVSNSRLDVQTHESGNLFTKKVTTTVDGMVSPVWFLVTPPEMQPYGSVTGQICASPSQVVPVAGGTSGDTACDAAKHVVQAGVVASQWSGGNIPEQEDNVYHWETSKSSLSVLSYVIITFLLFWAGGAIYGAAVGGGTSGAAAGAASTTGAAAAGAEAGVTAGAGAGAGTAGAGAVTGGGLGAGVTSGAVAGLKTWEFAGLVAGTYAAGSTGFGTNAGLTYAQGSYAGSTVSGVLASPTPNSEQQAGLQQAVQNRHINASMSTGLTGTRQLYMGNCPENYTEEQCNANGLNSGAISRPDTYVESNLTAALRQRYEACAAAGYVGEALAVCASPEQQGAFSEPN